MQMVIWESKCVQVLMYISFRYSVFVGLICWNLKISPGHVGLRKSSNNFSNLRDQGSNWDLRSSEMLRSEDG